MLAAKSEEKISEPPQRHVSRGLHYAKLMEDNAREICLNTFGYEVKGQAVYNGAKTTPSLLIVGANRGFLTANAYTLGYGRDLSDEDAPAFAPGNRRRQDDREAVPVPARITDR